MSYIGLHQHLDSSCLDGFQTRQELVSRAKSLGMNAVAITDHGTCAIHVKFAQECAKQSDDNLTIKPIFGIESYLVDDVHDIMTDRIAHTRAGKVKYNKETGEPELEKQRASDFNHCCLWAQNDKGLENLWTISTLSYTEGFYRKPRIDFNMLKKYGEGLFISDGCMLSRVSRCIANDDIKGAVAWEKKLIDAVGKDNVLVEIHTWQFCDPKTEEQFNLNRIMTKTNKVKIEIAKKLGLRTIAVNDAHYAKREDYRWHELVWQSTTGKGSDLNDDKTSGRGETAAWVMSEDECFYWLKKHGLDDEDIQTAIDNTQWVADHCNAKIKFGMVPPRYGDSKEDDDRLLEKLVLDGARERIPSVDQAQEYIAELKKELELIEKTDLSGYFLIVWDYVNFVLSDDEDGSKYGVVGKKASLLGVARGSSGASVVCYFLRITNIDPIKNSLYFERFLTAGRVVSSVNIKFEDGWKKFSPSEKISLSDGTSKDAWKLLYEEDDTEYGKELDSSFDFKDCPDIDLDFEASVIPQVDAYLKKRWGEWNVCRIGTELQGKISTSVHDVFAIHGYSSSDIFNLNRKIAATGWDTGEYMELQTYEDFIECISKDEDLKKIVDETEYFKEAWNFGGRIRTYGVHASGYVISKKSLLGKMPLRVAQGILVTQFAHDQVADMGFIKYDVLKLSSLGTMREVYESVHGKLDPESIYADMQNDKLFDGVKIWKPTWDGDVLGIFQLDTPLGKTTATNAMINSVSDAGMITAVDRPGLVRSGLIKDFYKVRKGEEGCPSYHPFTDSILEETSGFVVYQEQIMKIYSRLCNMNMEEADNVRKVFSKKQVTKVPAMKKLLYDVCLNDKSFIDNVPVKYSSPKECLDDLWVGISRTAEYSFNASHAKSYGMITAYEQYMKVRWPLQFICASLNTDPGQTDFLKYAIVRGYSVKTPNVNKSTDRYVVDDDTIYMPMWSIKGVGGKAVDEILNNGPYSSYDDFLDKTTGRGGRKKNVLQSLISIGAFDGVDERSRYDLMCAFAESKGLEKPYKKNFESDRIIAKIEQELLGVSLSYDDVLDNKDWLMSESPQSMAGLMKTDVGESTKIAGKITSTKTKNAKNGLMAWVTLKLVSQEEVKITVFANSYSKFKDYLSTGDLVSTTCKRSSDFNGAPSFICNYVFNKSIQQDR
jgi:DNA polymerase-3 subunit alpha